MEVSNCFVRELRLENFKSINNLRIDNITPFAVFLGKNGSGKSSILDSLSFLSDLLKNGCKDAVNRRGGSYELLSKNNAKHLKIGIQLYDDVENSYIEYDVKISIVNGNPVIEKESIFIENQINPYLLFEGGKGTVRELIDSPTERTEELFSSDVLALSVFGQLTRYAAANILYKYISKMNVYDFQITSLREESLGSQSDSLSRYGKNLENALYHLRERKPELFDTIRKKLQLQIPSLDTIEFKLDTASDANKLFMIDKGFHEPISKKYMSNGTLKMLAYYLLLMQPRVVTFMGLEEPENYIHPSFIHELTEICREASEFGQIAVSTHSPYFLDSMSPSEVWICRRNKDGVTVCENASLDERINTFIKNGAKLGHLWTEGYIED